MSTQNLTQSVLTIGYRNFVMPHDDAVKVYTMLARAVCVTQRYEKTVNDEGEKITNYDLPAYWAIQESDEIRLEPNRRVVKEEPKD